MLECRATRPLLPDLEPCGCMPERRSFLKLGLGLAMAGAASGATAGRGQYEAMLVNCIDPRFTATSHGWMGAEGMHGRFRQFAMAGGPIGAVHPLFAAWHATFWDNLAISADLHAIKRVVAFTHRDCGAARMAFGDAGIATQELETASHAAVIQRFRDEVHSRHPGLSVVAGIMALDGSVEPV